ncbi:phospholipase A and acyltransferase 4-like [Hipposideros larvatus]
MIEIFHIGYMDWAIYVGDGDVIHLAPPSEFPRFGSSNMFIFLSGTAVVTKESLRNAAWGCLYRVNNCFNHKFRPRPVNEIINSAKKMVPLDDMEVDKEWLEWEPEVRDKDFCDPSQENGTWDEDGIEGTW